MYLSRNLYHKSHQVESFFQWIFAIGLINLVLGLLATFYAGITTLLAVLYLGGLLTVNGLVTIYLAIRSRSWGVFWTPFIFGLLALFFGGVILAEPLKGANALTTLIAVYLAILGTSRLMYAVVNVIDMHISHRVWVGLTGLLNGFAAYLILMYWPQMPTWIIGFFIGLDFVLTGLMQVRIGWLGKKFASRAGSV